MVSVELSGPDPPQVWLVEEINEATGKIPRSLEALLSSLDNPDPNDCTVVLLYTLMIETGFIPVNAENACDNVTMCYGFDAKKLETHSKMPSGWKISGSSSYEIRFQVAPFSAHECKLLVLSMSDLLVVDVFIEKHLDLDESPFVLCFTMTVCSSDHVAVSKSPLGKCRVEFNNVVELAHKFKNTVASPARASILNNCGVINPSLLGLPEEVTLKILTYLDVKDVGNASQTCRVLNGIGKDQHLWFYLVNRDLKLNKAWSDEVNWSSFYEREVAKVHHKKPTPWNRPMRPFNASGRLKFKVFGDNDLCLPGYHLAEIQPCSFRPGFDYPRGFLGRSDFFSHVWLPK